MVAKPIPEGYHAVTPYLIIKGAAQAIDFYRHVFEATEIMRMADAHGTVGHAELKIGDSVIMLADEQAAMGYRSPRSLGGCSVSMLLYVPDVDAMFARALEAGARSLRPVVNQFYGDRSGTLEDPFGHTWTVATHIEDVAPEELQRRAGKVVRPAPQPGS